MKGRGQVILIVAFLIMVSLFLLALLVDGGRLYLRRAEVQRAAQAAADAGIGVASERMVTLAVPRQTEAALQTLCAADAEFGASVGSCTATPEPEDIAHWLTDEDRQKLVEPSMQRTVEASSLEYAKRNDYSPGDSAVLELTVEYPFQYQPEDANLQSRVLIRSQLVVLLAGLLGQESIAVPAEGVSEVPQR